MLENKKIGLVIPAHNEEALIIPTLERVPSWIDLIVVVDDASTDKQNEKVLERLRTDSRIVLEVFEQNQGVGAAIIHGYKKCVELGNCDAVLVVGGDNQMPLEMSEQLVLPVLHDECDYCKGNRFLRIQDTINMPFKRFIANSAGTFLMRLGSGYWHIGDCSEGFTCIKGNIIKSIDWTSFHKKYGYPMLWMPKFAEYGLRIKDVPRPAIYLKGVRQSQIKSVRHVCVVGPKLIKAILRRLFVYNLFRDFQSHSLFYISGIPLFLFGLVSCLFLMIKSITGTHFSPNWAIIGTMCLVMGIQFLLSALNFDMQSKR